jgi:Mn-dependent DtxR family transcriptional regulator
MKRIAKLSNTEQIYRKILVFTLSNDTNLTAIQIARIFNISRQAVSKMLKSVPKSSRVLGKIKSSNYK